MNMRTVRLNVVRVLFALGRWAIPSNPSSDDGLFVEIYGRSTFEDSLAEETE